MQSSFFRIKLKFVIYNRIYLINFSKSLFNYLFILIFIDVFDLYYNIYHSIFEIYVIIAKLN